MTSHLTGAGFLAGAASGIVHTYFVNYAIEARERELIRTSSFTYGGLRCLCH